VLSQPHGNRRTRGMLVVAGVTAAVIIPAGIGWLTRFGDIDWQRLAARLQGRDEHARDSEPLSPLATRNRASEDGARQREAASLLRFERPPRPVFDDPLLEEARAAEYAALRKRCQAEQATWNSEQRRWQLERAPLAEALVQDDLDQRLETMAAVGGEGGAPELLAHCAPDGTGGGGEAWLGYEEMGELRKRQRHAFLLRWNARLRAALEAQREAENLSAGGGRGGAIADDGGNAAGERQDESTGLVEGGNRAAACAGLGEGLGGAGQDPEGWLSSGMLRVEARPISANPSRDRMMGGVEQ
jgi:hypothetical protein